MENKINIAELLKDCPSGMELDCTVYDNVTLGSIMDGNCYPIQIQTPEGNMLLSKYGCMSLSAHSKCVIFPKGKTTWGGFQRPFKDGDILTVENESNPFIFYCDCDGFYNVHCALLDDDFISFTTPNKWTSNHRKYRLATEEEKQKLFDAIKANGYKWNPETKTLEKLGKEKFDITTLKPFESRVLVRGDICNFWEPAIFGLIKDKFFYILGGAAYRQCIPYKNNEHLLGTTNDCDEYYKTWE